MITLEQARKEFEKLTELMEEADRHRPRWQDLKSFLEMAERLSSEGNKTARKDEADTLTGSLPMNGKPTSEVAEYVLRLHGKELYIGDLAKQMKSVGWKGTKTERGDRDAVRSSLKRLPDKFVNEGGNVWNLKK